MKNKIFTKSLCGAMAGLLMAGSIAMPVFAAPGDPQQETNPTKMTIPVTATVDSTYEISVPADMFGHGGASISLTRDHNDQVKTTGDTANAFYGGSFITAKGTIGTGKKLEAKLTCTDLTDSAKSLTSAIGIRTLDFAQYTKAKKIWSTYTSTSDTGFNVANGDVVHDAGESLNFGAADTWNTGATGITFNFTGTITPNVADGTGYGYYMLHTVPEKDGSYEGTLTVNFGLKNN